VDVIKEIETFAVRKPKIIQDYIRFIKVWFLDANIKRMRIIIFMVEEEYLFAKNGNNSMFFVIGH
jgi:hypothetical protein